MASIDLTRNAAAPYLTGSVATVGANQAIAVNYPPGLRKLSVLAAGAAGEMSPTGTENNPLPSGANGKHPVAADQYLVVQVKPEGGTVYVQSATHPTTFYAVGELL